ncbi:MAG: hypothetical protein QOE70_232 [Chthoniobacter sp.]|nr:hypothetical protein [Chthoniobacter sp.]
MLRFLKTLSVVGLLALFVWWVCPPGELRHPPGVRVEAEPVQTDFSPRQLCRVHGYDLTAVAGYEMSARVLHTKHYWADGNDLVPYDVALGWGAMSDQSVLDQLEITQGNRFFFYAWRREPPLPVKEITTHAANNHLIAANDAVAAEVRHLRRGEFVRLRGYLVNVSRPDGFHWNTSLSRTDEGNGACEVFYVEAISVSDDPA